MSQRAVVIGDLRCDGCGSREVIAFAPGSDEQRDLFLLVREVPVKCWCEKCWAKEVA